MRRACRLLHGKLQYAVGTGQPLVLGDTLLPLLPCNDIFYDPPKLRVRLDEDGYLYLKNVVPRDVVDAALRDVSQQMRACNWLQTTDANAHTDQQQQRHGVLAAHDAADWLPYPMPSPQRHTSSNSDGSEATAALPPAQLYCSEAIRSAASGTTVMAAVRQVYGGAVRVCDVHTLHLGAPHEPFGFRMPSVYVNRGTALALVALVPLHDTPMYAGTPVLVRGSNSGDAYAAVRRGYGQWEVESGDIAGDGCYTTAQEELQARGQCDVRDVVTGARVRRNVHPFLSCALEAGDVLLMTVYTMHAYLHNVSTHWRVCVESLWTMEGDDVGPDARYVGADAGGLSAWYAHRDDRTRYPRTLDEAKAAWERDA